MELLRMECHCREQGLQFKEVLKHGQYQADVLLTFSEIIHMLTIRHVVKCILQNMSDFFKKTSVFNHFIKPVLIKYLNVSIP